MPALDGHTIAVILGVAALGGLIGLDRTAAGQFMISQPIVAGPLTGWLLGDAAAGLIIGAALELIWVLDLPVGTFVPADATVGAVSATAIAALGGAGKAGPDLLGFSVLLTTAMVPVTMFFDRIVRERNSRLVDAALSRVQGEAGGRGLSRAHLLGLVIFFLKSFVLYLVLLPAGLAAVSLFAAMPDRVHGGMALYVKLLPLLGVALVLRKLSIRTLDLFFLTGFVAAAVLALVFHAPPLIIILLAAATGLLGTRLRELKR